MIPATMIPASILPVVHVLLDVSAEPFRFAPLLIGLVLAATSLVVVVFVLRFSRKGKK